MSYSYTNYEKIDILLKYVIRHTPTQLTKEDGQISDSDKKFQVKQLK